MTKEEKKAYNKEILNKIENIIQEEIKEYGVPCAEMYVDVVTDIKDYLKGGNV